MQVNVEAFAASPAASVTTASNHRDIIVRFYRLNLLLDMLVCLVSSLWGWGDVDGLERVNLHSNITSKAVLDGRQAWVNQDHIRLWCRHCIPDVAVDWLWQPEPKKSWTHCSLQCKLLCWASRSAHLLQRLLVFLCSCNSLSVWHLCNCAVACRAKTGATKIWLKTC